MTVEIICADAREALAAMPEGSVHTCVTSPPYWGLRDYGLEPTIWGGDDCEHEWDSAGTVRTGRNDGGRDIGGRGGNYQDGGPHGQGSPIGAFCRRCNAWRGTLGLEPTPELYVEHIVQVMREVRRVLRDDGTLWLNLGDSYASNPAKGGSGTPNGRNNRGEGYARPLRRGSKRADGIVTEDSPRNRDGTPCPPGLKPKDLCGMPWRVAFALQSDGWWLRSDIVWSKPNPMPESVTDRPTRAHEYVFLLSKKAKYFYDADAIREPLLDSSIARISQPTFEQQTGGPKDYRHGTNRHRSARQGLENLKEAHERGQGRNKRTVWNIPTQPYPEAHFAVFPEKLVEPCILAGTSEPGCCPKCGAPWERVVKKGGPASSHKGSRFDHGKTAARDGGDRTQGGDRYDTNTVGWRPACDHKCELPVPCTVLDPFAGSGTVGVVAERLGQHSVLIDAKEEYCEMARHRTAQRGLMAEAAS